MTLTSGHTGNLECLLGAMGTSVFPRSRKNSKKPVRLECSDDVCQCACCQPVTAATPIVAATSATTPATATTTSEAVVLEVGHPPCYFIRHNTSVIATN